MYCILGAQVNVRSSILGSSGSAQEFRREFLVLMEDAVKQPDISKSVQRFQLAVQEAKVKLDLAISPGTLLVPSRMVINTESTVGYNNKLRRVTPNIKLGVNSDANADGTVNVGIKHNLGVSKVKLPHASHVLRKVAEKVEILVVVVKRILLRRLLKRLVRSLQIHLRVLTKHELNLILIMIAATAGAWLLFR